MPAASKDMTVTDLDYDDWEAEGKRRFYSGPSVCLVHDAIPTSEAEEEEWEQGEDTPEHEGMSLTPILFVRLFATPEEKAAIDARYATPDAPPFPAPVGGTSTFIAGRTAWVESGIAAGWASQVLDYNKVSIPVTEAEDRDSEESGELPCIHGIRLYTGAHHRDEVRASHSATTFRDL
jgi:hypothetical protein